MKKKIREEIGAAITRFLYWLLGDVLKGASERHYFLVLQTEEKGLPFRLYRINLPFLLLCLFILNVKGLLVIPSVFLFLFLFSDQWEVKIIRCSQQV